VAARLLDEGVASVVAMSHTVLVETARRFVTAFYQALVAGARVGAAMLKSQQALQSDTFRLKVFGGRDFHLHDWFVPVLFQEQEDVQLFRRIPSERIAQVIRRERRLRLGALPQKEGLQFVGRSRELLALERLLLEQPWAVVVGQGGEGKTTLAVELAQWLVQSQRYQRAAFVCLESVQETRAVVDGIGRQLVPQYSVAEYPAQQLLGRALQPIQRALEDERTVIVVDNVESALSDPWGFRNPKGLGALFTRLLEFDSHTRVIFTSREDLPEPFDPDKRRYAMARTKPITMTVVGSLATPGAPMESGQVNVLKMGIKPIRRRDGLRNRTGHRFYASWLFKVLFGLPVLAVLGLFFWVFYELF